MGILNRWIEKREKTRRDNIEKLMIGNKMAEIRIEHAEICRYLLQMKQNLEAFLIIKNKIPTVYEIEVCEECPIFERITGNKEFSRSVQKYFLSRFEKISPEANSLRDFFIDILSNNKVNVLISHIEDTIAWAEKLKAEAMEFIQESYR